MNDVKFFLSLAPPTATAQQKGVSVYHGKPFFYKKQKVKAVEETLSWAMNEFIPSEPIDDAVELTCVWKFAKKNHAKRWFRSWKKTRPDTDNLQKILKDVMTDLGFWIDDSRVCREIVEKWNVREEEQGIYVKIRRLKDEELYTRILD